MLRKTQKMSELKERMEQRNAEYLAEMEAGVAQLKESGHTARVSERRQPVTHEDGSTTPGELEQIEVLCTVCQTLWTPYTPDLPKATVCQSCYLNQYQGGMCISGS